MDNAVFDSLRTIISTAAGLEADDITPSSTFDSLGVDSLSTIVIATRVEDEFGARFELADLPELTSVAAFAERIEAAQEGGAVGQGESAGGSAAE